MFRNYNKYRLLKIFLWNPLEMFRLRELSRMSKIAPASVINYLQEFEKEGLLQRNEKRKIPFYQGLRDTPTFSLYQRLSILYDLHESGLINVLWEKIAPEVLILYGSFAKGEAVDNSDIDICIIGKQKKLTLDSFEKKLGRQVHLLFQPHVENISKELKNNLINGVILKGYFKVF